MFSSGLSSKVTVLKGTLDEVENTLKDILMNEMIASHFDFIFRITSRIAIYQILSYLRRKACLAKEHALLQTV